MSEKRTFVLELKNDQAITLEFTPIDATGNRLWQMFATTEALDTVQQLISAETRSARKTAPENSVVAKKKK
jgi:hypothetical protein